MHDDGLLCRLGACRICVLLKETEKMNLMLGGVGTGRLFMISSPKLFSMRSRPTRIRIRGFLVEGMSERRDEKRPLSSDRQISGGMRP